VIDSRNEIRNKNLFNVADCKIFWQKSGDYLCVKVDRFAKRKEKTEQKYTVSYSNIINFEFKWLNFTFNKFSISLNYYF